MHCLSARCLDWVAAVLGTTLAAAAVAGGDQSPVAVQYEDDFSYASGGRQIQINGQDPVNEGQIHCSMYTYGRPHQRSPGELKLIMTEDQLVNGPDGKPGVLRMEIADIPVATDYTGFVVAGNQESGAITISDWTPGEVTRNDLNRTYVSLRFRSENPQHPEEFSVPLSFRLEPDQEDSLAFAADFGALIPTHGWRTLKRPIGSAKNLEAFLDNVNREKPQRFKFVWSQIGPINLYQPGDGLLIDDLKITIE